MCPPNAIGAVVRFRHLFQLFEEEEDLANKSFFSEIIASISDVKFTTDGRYIISRVRYFDCVCACICGVDAGSCVLFSCSRCVLYGTFVLAVGKQDKSYSYRCFRFFLQDYLTLKIWDMNMESRPVKTIQIHEHLRSKLCDLYENDCIFDKFECAVSGDGNNLVLT